MMVRADSPRGFSIRPPWRWSPARLMVLVVGANVLWRIIRFLQDRPMWGDEGFVAVNFLLRDFAGLMQPLEHGQIAPLGYLWLVELTSRGLGESELALRLPAFLAGLLTVILIYALAKRLLDPRSALIAVAIFAASYYPARHAGEVKPYSIDLLVALLILLSATIVVREPHRAFGYILLALTAALGVWFSYPAVFIAGGAVLVVGFLALRDSEHRMARGAAALAIGALLAACFIAMYFLHARNQEMDAEWLKELGSWQHSFPPPIIEPGRLAYWLLEIHTGNFVAYPNGGNNFGSTATTLLIIAGAIWLWRRGMKWIVLLFLSPLVLNLIAAALHKYPYGESARVAQHMAPAFCLLAGAGAAGLMARFMDKRHAVIGARIAALVLMVIPIVAIVIDVVQPYKKYSDWQNRSATQMIAEMSGSNDRWIVFGAYRETPHAPNMRYWGGSSARFRYNVLLRSPRGVEFAPPPARLARPGFAGSTWLFKYVDNKRPFPEEQWAEYFRAAQRQLGAPVDIFEFDHRERKEYLTVYRFAPAERSE